MDLLLKTKPFFKQSSLQKILSKKLQNGTLYYQIKWLNGSSSWDSLEDLEPYKDQIESFEKSLLRKEKILNFDDEKPWKRVKKQKKTHKKLVQIEGSFKENDKIQKILLIKVLLNEETGEKEIFALVEWQIRPSGTTPFCSLINTKEIRLNDPGLLISFYEKKIEFTPYPISMERTEELYHLFFENDKEPLNSLH